MIRDVSYGVILVTLIGCSPTPETTTEATCDQVCENIAARCGSAGPSCGAACASLSAGMRRCAADASSCSAIEACTQPSDVDAGASNTDAGTGPTDTGASPTDSGSPFDDPSPCGTCGPTQYCVLNGSSTIGCWDPPTDCTEACASCLTPYLFADDGPCPSGTGPGCESSADSGRLIRCI